MSFKKFFGRSGIYPEESFKLTGESIKSTCSINELKSELIKLEKKPIKEKIEDRMKKYENEYNYQILPYESFIIRLDGMSFSKFTKKFIKPFDINFIKAIALTTRDLVEKFEAETGFTHSDEITLIFNAKCSKEDYNKFSADNLDKSLINIHLFDGQIQKLLTLISSYCSVRFNYHLEQIINNNINKYNSNLINLIKSHSQIFDAQILKFNEINNYEILNYQIWKSVHDCEKNAIFTYAHTFFGSKNIMNKNSQQMIQMLKENNIDWKNIPLYIKYGIYCKKILVNKQIDNNTVIRSEYIFKQFKINYSKENLNMLLNKYWDNMEDNIYLDNL